MLGRPNVKNEVCNGVGLYYFCNARQRLAKAIVVAASSAAVAAAFQVELCNNRPTLASLCWRVCFLFATLS